MKFQNKKLSRAVRMALVVGAVSMAPAGLAFAQNNTQNDQNSQNNPQQVQTVTVTGSRIRGVDIATQQPVFTITAQDIKRTGLTTVGDIVQQITSVGTPAFSNSAPLVSNTEEGGSYVNLRNLGAPRTLVLVNGHRWTTSIDGYTDVSNIPSSLIERIEVLKDGASAIYGSDAIAGVVNFILKDHFDGAQISAHYGQNQGGDGTSQKYTLTTGTSSDKGSVFFSASYQKQAAVDAKSRDYTRDQYPYHLAAGTSGFSPWGRITGDKADDGLITGNGLILDHTGGAMANGMGVSENSRNPGNYHSFNPNNLNDRYNFVLQETLRVPKTLKSFFTGGKYNLTDNITWNTTAAYSERDSTFQVAGYPNRTTSQPSHPVYIDGQSYYNPFPGHDLTFARRTVEIPRTTENNSKALHFDTALNGFFDVGRYEWNWDVDFNYNKNDTVQTTSGNLNLLALKQALGPSFLNADGVVQCGTAANPITLGTSLSANQCTPFDILGGPTASTPQALKYVNSITQRTVSTLEKSYSANLTGGMFELPGGTAKFAAGVESRKNSGYDRPDPIDQSGYTTNLAANSTSGSYRVNSGYLELNLPVLQDLPGIQKLSFDVASRYSHYSNFGSTTNNKYSFAWRPIDDLLVRGTYAQGFRAPTLGDVFGGGSQTFDQFLDPCDSKYGAAATDSTVAARCAADGVPANYRQQQSGGGNVNGGGAQGVAPFESGFGNASVQPETSITRTLGLVYSPGYLPGFTTSLDWYRIHIDNIITAIGAGTEIDNCYINGDANFCSKFSRDPTTHQITSLRRGNINQGFINTEGYDWDVDYRFPQTAFGQFAAHLQTAYISKDQAQASRGAIVTNDIGRFPEYRVKSTASLNWELGNWNAHWGLRYFSGLREPCEFGADQCNQPDYTSPSFPGIGANRHGAFAFNDLQVGWNTPWNGTISAGVNNVFNRHAPPNYDVVVTGYNTTNSYDPNADLTRFFYLDYTQNF